MLLTPKLDSLILIHQLKFNRLFMKELYSPIRISQDLYLFIYIFLQPKITAFFKKYFFKIFETFFELLSSQNPLLTIRAFHT